MKAIYGLMLLLCPCLGQAQHTQFKPSAAGSLRIGDTVPNFTLTNIIGYPAASQTIAALKGKLIILDFWSTWCAACIKKFPLLHSMQQAHKDQLQVFLVNPLYTRDTKQKIEALFGRLTNNQGRPLQLPVVVQDTIATRWFPHTLLPHYVWIDKNGRLLAITGIEELTAANIEAVLQNNPPAFSVKEDIENFNPLQPLFINGNAGNGAGIQYRSTLAAYISGLPSGSSFTKDNNGLVAHLLATNTPLLQLLLMAYRKNLAYNRIIFQPGTARQLNGQGKDDDWIVANSYCYELINPPLPYPRLCLVMQQDLQRFFGLSARMQNHLVNAIIITADTLVLKNHKSSPGPAKDNLAEYYNRFMQNSPLSTLQAFLDQLLHKPVQDESAISYNINLCLPDNLSGGLPAIQKALAPYGIYLSEAPRTISMFTIYHQQPKQ